MPVIILGAGTSIDYGYPSGLELVEEMKNRLRNSHQQPERRLLEDLIDRNPYSIDSFLNVFPRHEEAAKGLISEILYERENLKLSFPRTRISIDFCFKPFLNQSSKTFRSSHLITIAL